MKTTYELKEERLAQLRRDLDAHELYAFQTFRENDNDVINIRHIMLAEIHELLRWLNSADEDAAMWEANERHIPYEPRDRSDPLHPANRRERRMKS